MVVEESKDYNQGEIDKSLSGSFYSLVWAQIIRFLCEVSTQIIHFLAHIMCFLARFYVGGLTLCGAKIRLFS